MCVSERRDEGNETTIRRITQTDSRQMIQTAGVMWREVTPTDDESDGINLDKVTVWRCWPTTVFAHIYKVNICHIIFLGQHLTSEGFSDKVNVKQDRRLTQLIQAGN